MYDNLTLFPSPNDNNNNNNNNHNNHNTNNYNNNYNNYLKLSLSQLYLFLCSKLNSSSIRPPPSNAIQVLIFFEINDLNEELQDYKYKLIFENCFLPTQQINTNLDIFFMRMPALKTSFISVRLI